MTASNESKSTLSNLYFYVYQWSFSDEDNDQHIKQNIIRAYGWNTKNESCLITVSNFDIPVVLELPRHIIWNDSAISQVKMRIQDLVKKKGMEPSRIEFEYRHSLYYANVERTSPEDKSGIKYKKKLFPYLRVYFHSSAAVKNFSYRVRNPVQIGNLGMMQFKLHEADKQLTPVFKLLGINNINSSGWIKALNAQKLKRGEKYSTREHEYDIRFENLRPVSEKISSTLPIVLPSVLAFDNEANSSIKSSMPSSHRPTDVIFQIGFVYWNPRKNILQRYLISLGEPDPIEDVIIITAKTEGKLITTIVEKITELDAEVIIGFNILGWDIPYMIERSKGFAKCYTDLRGMGCIPTKLATEDTISWSSSAYGKQDFKFLDSEGRLFIDLLPYIKRNYKLVNYRLETICDEFLKTNKDPLKPKDIFRCYKQFTGESLSLVGKYCCQDAYVCILLFQKLQVWYDLSESACVNQVRIFDMITKGQQIKLYSQIYRYCWNNNTVVESGAFKPTGDEKYTGAFVSEPKKGLYRRVLPFDFNSLYPSIMRAYNIDFSKLVLDPSIPPEDCHVMEWEEHLYCGCPKDTKKGKKPPKDKNGKVKRVCAAYKYSWLRKEVSGKGIVPILLDGDLGARKATRGIIAENETEINVLKHIIDKIPLIKDHSDSWVKRLAAYEAKNEKIPTIELIKSRCYSTGTFSVNIDLAKDEITMCKNRISYLEDYNRILDRRQNAYKINANSKYGALGASKGYLPFLPGAMCVTYKGRQHILEANNFIENEKKGLVIYNDTDSSYSRFPEYDDRSIGELWNVALGLVKDIRKLYPDELQLAFEEKVYEIFLILSKKRYIARIINQEGKFEKKLMKRGVVLQRRDNCLMLRVVYENLINGIFDRYVDLIDLKDKPLQVKLKHPSVIFLLEIVNDAIDSLFRWSYPSNKEGVREPQKLKDFIITKAMTKDPSKYKTGRIPSHVLLALRMIARGVPVGEGSRIEYLIKDNENELFKRSKVSQKELLVDFDYFTEYREIFRINRLLYLKTFIPPIDQVISVAMGIDNYVKNAWLTRINYQHVVQRIKTLGRPSITSCSSSTCITCCSGSTSITSITV